MKTVYVMAVLLLLAACGGQEPGHGGTGRIALAIKSNTTFDPNIDHGRIDYFLVSISGEGVTQPIKQKFGYDTESAVIDGLLAGKTVDVTIEAINFNGFAIMRGTKTGVMVTEDVSSVADLSVNPVPVFANVGHNATVYANRFVPKIYAPNEISFSVSAMMSGSESLLTDSISGLINFSTSADDSNSVKTIYSSPLAPGPVTLTAEDVETGEATSILVNVVDTGQVKGLPTTAGAYMGTLMSSDAFKQSTNMNQYFESLVQ